MKRAALGLLRRLEADTSGLPAANVSHLRRIERLVWAAVGGYVAAFAAFDRFLGHTVPPSRREGVRLTALAVSSLVATLGINRVTLSRSAAFGREREAHKEALRQSEERLRAVLQNAPVILFATDARGVFTLAEGRGLGALGRRPGETVGKSVFERYAHVPAIGENIRRALAGEAFTSTVEVGELSFETRYEPLRDSAGEVNGVIGVAADVTERLRLEAARAERARLDGALLVVRTVAHDINNALSPVTGGVELLRLDPEVRQHPSRSSYLTMIQSGAAAIGDRVRRLQSIVRLVAQPSPLGPDQPILDIERSTSV